MWGVDSRTLQDIVHLAFLALSMAAPILASPAAQLCRRGNDNRLFAGLYSLILNLTSELRFPERYIPLLIDSK